MSHVSRAPIFCATSTASPMREVGRMAGREAEAVEGEDFDAAEQSIDDGGNAVRVGDVGEVADAEAEDCPVAVLDGDRA